MPCKTGNFLEDRFVKGIHAEFKKEYGGEITNTVKGCLKAMLFMLKNIKSTNGNEDYEILDCRVGELMTLTKIRGENAERYGRWIEMVERCYANRAGIPLAKLVEKCKIHKRELEKKSPNEYGENSRDSGIRTVSLDLRIMDDLGEIIR